MEAPAFTGRERMWRDWSILAKMEHTRTSYGALGHEITPSSYFTQSRFVLCE